jgi:phosphate transport system permease protein
MKTPSGWRSGDGALWLSTGAVTLTLLLTALLLVLLGRVGFGHFWPEPLATITFDTASGQPPVVAALREQSTFVLAEGGRETRTLLRTGNRDTAPPDFRWVADGSLQDEDYDRAAIELERHSWGPALGLLAPPEAPAAERAALATRQWARLERALALPPEARTGTLTLFDPEGSPRTLPFREVVRAWRPNAMGLREKLSLYFARLGAFLTEPPREANTEGGIFPALFGTVLMVMLMTIVVTPIGVVAAVYLHEYAPQGTLTQTLRIAVNNLAGVPSIVYGVFGLGFFVYVVGGSLDRTFFADALPAPTFGTPGLLWASLTLALLTLPVMIVATEEGLSRIPRQLREASLALGATRLETLRYVILPQALPAVLTGVILAVARGAGEVAPLMLVGVVKLAPELPLDSTFPFLHLDRQFMHLGFHIYDLAFQSPNVEAARPLVYASALLLVLMIVFLNLGAVLLRAYLRGRHRDPLG